MTSTVDAVVVGSGINGLVAAAELARAGWDVAVVERNEQLGGFVAGGQITAPGYLHDTFSSWHVEFVTGGAYAALGDELHRRGLVYRNAEEHVTGSVRADGSVVLAHRDPERTAAAFAQPGDREAYLSAITAFGADIPYIGALLGGELRSPRALSPVLRLARRGGGVAGLERRLRDVATSGRAWIRRTFDGDEVDALWVPWLLHSGLSPDHASGGLMLPLFAGTIHAAGLPVVEGGAARFLELFEAMLADHGVRVITGEPVEHIDVRDGRSVAVRTASQEVRARRAVIASVAPAALYGQLLAPGAVPAATVQSARRYRPGRAAMQIHLALNAPPRWRDDRLASVPLLHLSDGASSTGIACAQAEAGLLPSEATVVVGQQSVLDPSRVPAGAATLWIQLQEVPFRPIGDAAGELDAAGRWTPALAEAYADRIVARIERHAPGLSGQIVGRCVLSPDDIVAHNPNAIDGDPYGGAPDLDQRLLWRPIPEAPSHATPIDGLWHIGAATHPGPGLSAASGHMVAQTLLKPRARVNLRRR